MLTLAMALGSAAAIAAVLALWQRAEAVAARAGSVRLARLLDDEVSLRAEDKRRLEQVIGDLKQVIKVKDNELLSWLRAHPGDAGEYLRRVLQDLPADDAGDGVPSPVASRAEGGKTPDRGG